MKIYTASVILLLTILATGCGHPAQAKPNLVSASDLAPEASTADTTNSFWDMPYLEQAFIDATPADRKDGLIAGELGVDGGRKDMIVKLAQEIAADKHGLYDSLLVSHKGKLLFESYYLRGRVDLPHFQ